MRVLAEMQFWLWIQSGVSSSAWAARPLAREVHELGSALSRVLIGAWVSWRALYALVVRYLSLRRLARCLAFIFEGLKRAAYIFTSLHVQEVGDGFVLVDRERWMRD